MNVTGTLLNGIQKNRIDESNSRSILRLVAQDVNIQILLLRFVLNFNTALKPIIATKSVGKVLGCCANACVKFEPLLISSVT